MNGYTVTIAPDDAREATAIIRYELAGDTPRITNFSLVAAEGHSLSTAQMPAVDFKKLLGAVLPAVSGTATSPAIAQSTAPAAAVETTAAEPAPTRAVTPAVISPRVETVGNAPRGTATAKPRRARAARIAPAKATATPTKAAKKAPAPKTTSRKAAAPTKKAAASKAAASTTAPARNTMPENFVEIYRQAPTRTAIADYFNVKDYTAQSWINTARRRGLIPAARKRG